MMPNDDDDNNNDDYDNDDYDDDNDDDDDDDDDKDDVDEYDDNGQHRWWRLPTPVFNNALIPWYPISYLTIASSVFLGGRLRVPTRRCDLVVPADGGWGRSN